MPKKKTAAPEFGDGSRLIDKDTYIKLIDLMDELAFRGPTQEALIMRVANLGGFDEVITRIKRRRLYTKKMNAGGDNSTVTPITDKQSRKGKKGGKKKGRPTNPAGGGAQSEEGTGGE